MSPRRSWRFRTVATATAVSLLILPVHLAAAQPAPATASHELTAVSSSAGAATLTLKIGISQDTLAEFRSQGRQARSAGKPTLPVPGRIGQSTQRTIPDEAAVRTAPPALTLLGAQQTSKEAAAASPPPSSEGDAPKPFVAAPIGETPDAALSEACFKAGNVETGIGRIHNRFTY